MSDKGKYKKCYNGKMTMAYCQQLLDKWGTCTYLSYSITACLYFNICGSQVPLRLSQTFMQAFTS